LWKSAGKKKNKKDFSFFFFAHLKYPLKQWPDDNSNPLRLDQHDHAAVMIVDACSPCDIDAFSVVTHGIDMLVAQAEKGAWQDWRANCQPKDPNRRLCSANV